jgi:hypothetical protein
MIPFAVVEHYHLNNNTACCVVKEYNIERLEAG